MATYAIKWEDKILVTEQNRNSLEWYKFIQEEIQEIDKIKQNYKETQKSIVDIKSELQEINDTYKFYNETWKSIADLRKVSLNERLINLRLEKDELVLSWIEKYWIEIQNEF